MIYIQLTDEFPKSYTVLMPLSSQIVETFDIIDANEGDDIIDANDGIVIIDADGYGMFEADIDMLHYATHRDNIDFTYTIEETHDTYATVRLTLNSKPYVGMYKISLISGGEVIGTDMLRIIEQFPERHTYNNDKKLIQR